ncbi:MAG: response regulator [Myxococcales bacterium]|nr:response regulator [Myxococcota bacterium]MDW8283045.1 response regulator [Myxococcales bacterium]
MDSCPALLGPRASVLLVAQQRLHQRAVAEVLQACGCALRIAAEAEAALALLAAVPSDLVIWDVVATQAPDPQALRSALGEGTLLLLGTPAVEGAELLALAEGCLPWPLEPSLLLRSCERALQRTALARKGRRFDHALRQAEKDWGRLLDILPDALVLCDADGHILCANRALCDLVGLDTAELRRRLLDEALSPLQLRPRLREALTTGAAFTFDESPPGLGRTFTITVSPLRQDGAATGAAVILLRDVTDERRLQRRLLLGERMAAVGQLAAGLAHEINNPLSFVLSNLQLAGELLQSQSAQMPTPLRELEEMLGECLVGVRRVRDIVRDLRTFASTEAHTADGEVRLDDLIDVAIRLTRSEVQRRARLVYERDLSPLPPLRGDAGKLGHVLLNLLEQALHNLPAPEDSGRCNHCITVRTRVDRRLGQIEIAVADTGPTLSEEVRAHLFEPFSQRRLRLPPGLSARAGMGLAVSYEVVQRHGGQIEARPGPQGGNELIVRLPLVGSVGQAPPPRVPRRRVLFVDDEPLLLRSYHRLIGDLHDVTTVASGREALALLQQGQSFDTIFCDVMMPAMNGLELHQAVADRDARCARRFVFLTGGGASSELLERLRQVDNPRVDKPVARESLVRAIELQARVAASE